MLFYKISGAAIVLACGLAGGGLLNSRDSRELSQIEALLELLKFIKVEIECFALSAPQILARCDIESLFLCGYEYDDIPKSFDEFISRSRIKNKEAEKIFSDFARTFGKSYRDEQIRQCEYHIGLLENIVSGLRDQLVGKRKLNSTLCAAGALAVIILLI